MAANPVVSALATYIEDRDFPLVAAIQYNPEMTASMATVQSGIKGSSKLHFMATDVNFLDGDNCDRGTPTDASTFIDKTITVADMTIAENWCLNILKNKWTQILMQKGTLAGKQMLPEEIASVYWEEINTLFAQALDAADWQGDTTSVTGNLNKYDGWIKYVDAGTQVNGNTGSLTAIITSNILAALDAMFLAIPVNIRRKPDLTLFIPIEWHDLYVVALKNANLFHYSSDENETKLYGTSITLKPTWGLVGTDRMFLTYGSNLVLGVDGENDTEFRQRLDPVSEKLIFVDADFTRGTQIQFVGDVVEFRLVTAS